MAGKKKNNKQIIWRNRDNIEVQSMFSQANLQYYASLHYIEEKYGVGALKHIRTKKYTSIGSPLNAEELITFLRDKEIIKNPNHTNVEIKNDNLDLVASIVGFNGKSIIKRDPIIENKIKNNEKYGLLVPHSHYSYGLQLNSYIYYNGWQNILIYSDKFLEKLNIKSYFRKKEIIEINKGAERNEKID